ncbi:cupin domain-containing protein [Paraburkholderia phytofirmans]|uniref:cupin domain-containing protein n=1 Tax=Paraburkholderia phytofirmans TaxID=261302 RepID=UPI0038B92CE5
MQALRFFFLFFYFFNFSIRDVMGDLSIVDFSAPAKESVEYMPKAEAVLAGDPLQMVHTHFSSPCGQLAAGIWEGACGQWAVNFTESEYCEILEGVSVIRDADGVAKTVRAGDRFLIPAGFKGTWEVVEPCRKVFVSAEFKG